MFTKENVFEKRAEFENACKRAQACKEEFHKLLKAETKSEFMQVIFDNFYWVYEHVDKFGLEYDFVDNFYEGFARVKKGGKYGFIDTSFKEFALEYDYVGDFYKGFARVKKGKKWGFVNTKFEEVCGVRKGGKWGKLYPDGREVF